MAAILLHVGFCVTGRPDGVEGAVGDGAFVDRTGEGALVDRTCEGALVDLVVGGEGLVGAGKEVGATVEFVVPACGQTSTSGSCSSV